MSDARWQRLQELFEGLLDRTPGWTRAYADGIAVVHVRTGEAR